MIVTDKFKSFSLFTEEELEESILRDIENMSETERAVFFEMLQNPQFEGDLNALELDREMVPVDQWLEDDYFMGNLGKSIYRPWKDDLIELFESGQYDTSVIQGGIGCAKDACMIATDKGQIPIGDLNQSHRYLSYDNGKARYIKGTHAFVKGKDMLYKVSHALGDFEVTAHHKVLCHDGLYRRVDQLHPGDLIVSSSSELIQNDAAYVHLVTQRLKDCLDDCLQDSRLCDELLQLVKDIGQFSVPLQDDVRPFFPGLCGQEDDLQEPELLYIQQHVFHSDPSRKDFFHPSVDRLFFDSDLAYARISQQSCAIFQRLVLSRKVDALPRIAKALVLFAQRTFPEDLQRLYVPLLNVLANHVLRYSQSRYQGMDDQSLSLSLHRIFPRLISHGFAVSRKQSKVFENKAGQVFGPRPSLLQRIGQLLQQSHRSLFQKLPSSLSSLSRLGLVSANPLPVSFGTSVVTAIEKTATDWYWDLQVPATNNYMMGGAVHHNCLAGDVLVQLADGTFEKIQNLQSKSGKVISWKKDSFFFGVDSGVKEVLEIEFASGIRIKATADHRWMTQFGWVKTSEIRPEVHRIKSSRTVDIKPTRHDVSVEEAEWAGIFISAGKLHKTSIAGVTKYIFIKADQDRIELFKSLCVKVGIPTFQPSNGYIHLLENDILPLLNKLMIDDPINDKHIPKPVLQSSNEVLAGFFRGALISCSLCGYLDSKNTAITFPAQKREYLLEMMLALRRFGIRGKMYSFTTAHGYESWSIHLKGKTNLCLFDKQIGFMKNDMIAKFRAIIEILSIKKEKSHSDFLPINYAEALAWTKKYNVSIGRTKYAKWCAKINADARVSHLDFARFLEIWPHMKVHAHEMFYDPGTIWEDIRSIKADGERVHTYDLIVPDDNCFLANGMLSHNSGKSTFSHLAVLRMLYEASCLKNPAVSYGLAANSIIGFCSLAKSKETARRVVFEQLAAKIQESPYFKYDFPPVKDLKDEIVFPKGLAIICGSSTDTSIIGMNIFGGIIDEVNFWGKVKKSNLNYGKNWGTESKSGRLFDSVRRRMKSRYVKKGKLPGIIMLISSKTTKDSFTEQFIRKEQALGNKSTFVRDRSILEMKKDSFGSKTFRVLVGTVDYASRILIDGEDVSSLKDPMVIEIPDDFRIDFESNLEESLRDIAGVSTIAISNFIAKVDKINEMVDTAREHPFQCALMDDPNTWDSRRPYKVNWDAICNRRPNGEWEPKINPEAPRHVHFDPAYTGDAFGVAIGHVGGMRAVQTPSEDEIVEYQPVFVIDFMLKIQGSKEHDVLNYKVRELIYEFAAHGFHFAEFSMDTYQSREMCQALEQQGYKAGIYSVDTGNSSKGENVVNTAVGRAPKAKQAYWYLRSAIYENRVKCYYYPVLLGELRRLEDGPDKVDHPEGESKDLADALCGVVWTLFRSRFSGEFIGPSKGIIQNPSLETESMQDYQESITDRHSNTVQPPSAEVLEIKGTKVYQKKKPQTIGPKYQKVSVNGAVQDLTLNIDDYLQRG